MNRKEKRPRFFIKKRGRPDELFDILKYKKSLVRSGIPDEMCKDLLSKIDEKKSFVHSSASLFSRTHKAIFRKSKVLAAHYNIKRSISDLGPTGYPFEVLSAEILKTKGFKTKISVVKKGKYVSHEVDVVAERPDLTLLCECKFHRRINQKNDVKVPLYIYARYLDIMGSGAFKKAQYAIMSNTNFSKDAITYAEGVGLILFSPDYPRDGTFIDLMKKYRVYPVTIMKSLKKPVAAKLLEKNVVVLGQLREKHLRDCGLAESLIESILEEREELLMQ